MLRRKLVIIFGVLVGLLLVTTAGAIWLLQGTLTDLRELDAEGWVVNEQANDLGTTISLIEVDLYELELGRSRHLDGLIDHVETMGRQIEAIGQAMAAHQPDAVAAMGRIQQSQPRFRMHVAALGTAQDPQLSRQHRAQALTAAVALRHDILDLNRAVCAYGHGQQAGLVGRFRALVLVLTVVFLVVINVAIVVLLRAAAMVLRPMEKLVEATRQLAQERFDHRVELDQKDEFDELARAYNRLAGELRANEQRKLDTLRQVAATLNHELNNALAIIELQLQLLSRQAVGNPKIEGYARQIHDGLDRMRRTVELLKNVRRIVLTEYTGGVQMLDLEKSAEQAAQGAEGEDARRDQQADAKAL